MQICYTCCIFYIIKRINLLVLLLHSLKVQSIVRRCDKKTSYTEIFVPYTRYTMTYRFQVDPRNEADKKKFTEDISANSSAWNNSSLISILRGRITRLRFPRGPWSVLFLYITLNHRATFKHEDRTDYEQINSLQGRVTTPAEIWSFFYLFIFWRDSSDVWLNMTNEFPEHPKATLVEGACQPLGKQLWA